MMIRIVYPESRWVSEAQILRWYLDAIDNRDIAPEDAESEPDSCDPMVLARALDDLGFITIGKQNGQHHRK